MLPSTDTATPEPGLIYRSLNPKLYKPMDTKYKVVRYFRDGDVAPEIMMMGLSLEEARAWCKNPETSSRTCTKSELIQMTEEFGPWFDGYEEM